MFKRTIREAALKHDIYATFMAKPIQGQPGSAMHIHQSIIDKKTGRNIFSAEDGSETEAFFHFIGGMQKHVPNALVMFAPYVNSYRRLTQAASAPVNNKWGYDNRTTAFRVPRSDPAARRVENRIPSSDANPYLALAASLACGLIGMTNKLEAEPPVLTTANEDEIDLPRGLLEAVDLFEGDEELCAHAGQVLRRHLCGDQAGGIRDLHGSDQPVGAGIPAAERVTRIANSDEHVPMITSQKPERYPLCAHLLPGIPMPYQSPSRPAVLVRGHGRPAPDPALDGDRNATSSSSAAASPACRRPPIWPRQAAMSCLIEAHRFGDGASGPQWRPARHRPARLGRGTGGRIRFLPRQGAVRPRRGGQGASARIRRRQQDRHRLHAGPAVGGAQEALCRRLQGACRDHGQPLRLSAYLLHGRAGDGRAAGLDPLFRRHPRHRHRPHPPAEAGDRHGARGGAGGRAAVREHAVDRHRLDRRQGHG